MVDKNLFKQVIVNLVLNSIDAIREKNIQDGYIKISTYYNKDKNKIQTTVEDNGIGIKQEHKDKIFKPFFTTNRKEQVLVCLWFTKLFSYIKERLILFQNMENTLNL
jgi:Signal transduction histidine kinase regulating C4-dicarboxylate transport system